MTNAILIFFPVQISNYVLMLRNNIYLSPISHFFHTVGFKQKACGWEVEVEYESYCFYVPSFEGIWAENVLND